MTTQRTIVILSDQTGVYRDDQSLLSEGIYPPFRFLSLSMGEVFGLG